MEQESLRHALYLDFLARTTTLVIQLGSATGVVFVRQSLISLGKGMFFLDDTSVLILAELDMLINPGRIYA